MKHFVAGWKFLESNCKSNPNEIT